MFLLIDNSVAAVSAGVFFIKRILYCIVL